MRSRCVVPVLALLWGLGAAACYAPEAPGSLAFRDVRVFDGERTIARATVLVEDGHIAGVGTDLAIPRGARVIEGEGWTLLPGLIDAHAHLHEGRVGLATLPEAAALLRRSLMFGVTTAISLGGDPALEKAYSTARMGPGSTEWADVLAAGWPVTPPGGHGTAFGGPTLVRAEDADAFVRTRVDEGAHHIKIMYQLGSSDRANRPPNPNLIPMFEEPVMRAAVEAAHGQGKTVAVHVNSLAAAKDIAHAGATVLAHVFGDQVADDEVTRLLLENGMYVTPTFTVNEQIFHESEWTEADDPHFVPYLSPDEIAMLRTLGNRGRERPPWTNMIESVRALHAAGVPMLAGVDNAYLGGLLMHHELESLVSAGLDPADALVAATSAPADAFGLEDRGRIVPGARADLLLVRGDPSVDITVTRDIVGVWKLGVEADRAGYAEEKRALSRMLESDDELVLADFEAGDGVPTFGSLREEVTFGSGSAEIEVVDGGPAGSGYALSVSGRVTEADHRWVGSPFWFGDYAGVSFRPALGTSNGTMDFSAKSGIAFWARGDSAVHRVWLFTGALDSRPVGREFEVGPEWTEFTLPLSSFEAADLSTFWRVFLAAGPEPGDFRFEVDGIRIR